MKAVYHIEARGLEGLRPPPVPFTTDGMPILPRKGDIVVIANKVRNVPLFVEDVVWILDHDVEKNMVAVYLKGLNDLPNPYPPGSVNHSRWEAGVRDNLKISVRSMIMMRDPANWDDPTIFD